MPLRWRRGIGRGPPADGTLGAMSEAPPRLVTPEAVALQFETAGLGSRTLAMLIDLAIQGTLSVAALVAVIGLSGSGQSATAGVVVVLLVLTAILLGYPIAFEALWRGRTPGKAALGLRVVTTDGAPIRFRHAAVRGFLSLVDFYLTSGAAAVLTVLSTRDNQRLGDLAAGTLVLRQRTGAKAPVPVSFSVPPGWEPYAATLDPAGLTGDDHVAVRSFLLRAPSLPPGTRSTLGAQIATTVAGHMGHVPPPGTHPEGFLACVAAVHQQRAGTFPAPATGSVAAAAATERRSGGDAGPGQVPPPGGTSNEDSFPPPA